MKKAMSLVLVGVLSATLVSSVSAESTSTQDSFSAQLSVAAAAIPSGDAIVKDAEKWIGTPYKYGGNSRKGIDCSHFVNTVYKEVGLSYTHTSATYWSQHPNSVPKGLV
ncbi:MAG TPA: NlpC/P60 family protein, partial [Clostridia bacterium]